MSLAVPLMSQQKGDKMFKITLSALTLISSLAQADIYLAVGESINYGRETIYCGVNRQPEERMYRCSMQVCIDPWNKISDSDWMCTHSSSYTFQSRSEVGTDKTELFSKLATGIHKPETFYCVEL